jgi:hypothetical protein
MTTNEKQVGKLDGKVALITVAGIAFSLNSKFTKTARDKGPHRQRSMKRQAGATRSTPAIQRALHYDCAL